MDVALKLQEDAFDRAEELAAELRIDAPTALGHLSYMWRWANRVLCPEGSRAPDGIIRGRSAVIRLEAAARWKGVKGAFVAALERMQLIARTLKKIRVKGTQVYADEQKKRMERARVERERRAAKKKAEQAANPPKPRLVATKISEAALNFWRWMMHERAQDVDKPDADPMAPRDFRILRAGCAPDFEPPPSFGEWFENREREGISLQQLARAWFKYLGDTHFESRSWPVAVFMTENVYRARLTA